MIRNVHESLMHRGLEAVYYNIRESYYWPGIKKEIGKVLKECEICKIVGSWLFKKTT